MEADKRYFLEGLFIIGLALAAALAFVWLSKSGQRDDVLYRIHFSESVSGLSLGDKVIVEGLQRVRPGQPVSPGPASPLIQSSMKATAGDGRTQMDGGGTGGAKPAGNGK